MAALSWTRRVGRSLAYYTAETEAGRIRISRVNKFGAPAFRVYFPDGKNFTADSIDAAKAAAENRMAAR